MPTPQRHISLSEFGQAMRDADPVFASWVGNFETRFGSVDVDMLGVLAQASYFCWFEQEYIRDFTEVCRAIGTRHLTSLYLCNQVTPTRWIALHAYVVGIQHWLGIEQPIPASMDPAKIEQISVWLAERTPIKEDLVKLYLRRLCHRLADYPLSILVGKVVATDECYEDFAAWYPLPSNNSTFDENLADFKLEAQRHNALSADVGELLEQAFRESQPGCMHRFTRYQDIAIASIGTLKWRGMVPAETDAPKWGAAQYFNQAVPAVKAWCCGRIAIGTIGSSIQALLGERTEWKVAVINDFLLKSKDCLSDKFYYWIQRQQMH